MSPIETIKAAYAAFGRNDPFVLFAAMERGCSRRSKNGGAPLDSPCCHVFRFHSDKVVMFQQYTDTASGRD
jgi:hypothetical protein